MTSKTKITTVTRITIPIAMVISLTIAITESEAPQGFLLYVMLVAAFCTGVGLELWGIVAGNNLTKAWKLRRGQVGATVQVVVYAAIGAYLLRHNPTLVILPLVAMLAYVSTALSDRLDEDLEEERKEEQTNNEAERQEAAAKAEFEREQEAADREHQRQLQKEELELKARNNLEIALAKEESGAKIAAAKAQLAIAKTEARRLQHEQSKTESGTVYRSHAAGSNGHLPGDFRLLTDHQKEQIKALTTGELSQIADISDSTARRWKRQVAANGYHK